MIGGERSVGGGGNDRINGTGYVNDSHQDVLKGGSGRDHIAGDDSGRGRDVIRGGADADKLRGLAHRDRIFGEAGDDELRGGPGDDHLDGGTGTDTCDQGPGAGAVVNCEA